MNPEGGGNVGGEPPLKKRGPYKQYLYDPSIPIPASTLHSREKASRAADAEQGGTHVPEIEIHPPNNNQNPEVQTQSEDLLEDGLDHQPCKETSTHENPENTSEIHEHGDKDQEKNPHKSKKSYVEKHQLSNQLHRDSPLTRLDALLMILHLAVRHCHTQHFIEDQIKFVNALFGEPVLDVSYYIFKTLFKPSVDICKHYMCIDCEYYLGTKRDFYKAECPQCNKSIASNSSGSANCVICGDCKFYLGLKEDFPNDAEYTECPKCSKNIDLQPRDFHKHVVCFDCKSYVGLQSKCSKRIKTSKCPKCKKEIDVYSVDSNNYFISLNPREQIQDLVAKPGLKFINRSNRNPNLITDMCDGQLYKKLSQPGFPLANENTLSVTFNTDGVQVHNSTSNSLWPIWLYINEVVPEQRFKQENLILAGLWFGKSAPNMSFFLKQFCDQVLDLSVNGVDCIKPDGTSVKYYVFPIACSVDSVAKPKLMCKKQFNAKMGCLYCYHPNDATIGNERTQRYYDQTVNYKIRTEDEVIRDMYLADDLQRKGELKKDSVNGFLGISILTSFTKRLDVFPRSTFDLVWGVVIDYLHAALEGVASDLFNIFENIMTVQQLSTLDEYIKNITPPQGMTRRPRSFTIRPFWKAKEFRAVLLFYALPCFEELLPDRKFPYLKHFVNVLHILLSDSISHAQLSKAASALSNFTVGYQRLYGLQNVSYNLHICRHFIDMVIQVGPLYCYSNFIFESGNGYLVSLVKGTKSVINEIANKHTTIQTVSKFITENNISPQALKFCSDVMQCNYSKSQTELDSALVTSLECVGAVSEEEEILLEERNVIVSDGKVKYYNRVIREGIVYACKSFSRAKVYDDSCVLLTNGSYAVIEKFAKSSTNELLCLIKPIRVAQGADLIPSIKRCCYDVYDTPRVVSFSDISRKCLFLCVKDKCFVSHIPNFYERD